MKKFLKLSVILLWISLLVCLNYLVLYIHAFVFFIVWYNFTVRIMLYHVMNGLCFSFYFNESLRKTRAHHSLEQLRGPMANRPPLINKQNKQVHKRWKIADNRFRERVKRGRQGHRVRQKLYFL